MQATVRHGNQFRLLGPFGSEIGDHQPPTQELDAEGTAAFRPGLTQFGQRTDRVPEKCQHVIQVGLGQRCHCRLMLGRLRDADATPVALTDKSTG
jgi:hypothetical protein